ASPAHTAASACATKTSSSCSSACGRATSWNSTRNARRKSRSCSGPRTEKFVANRTAGGSKDPPLQGGLMLALKYVLLVGSIGFFGAAAGMLIDDWWTSSVQSRPFTPRWPLAARCALVACLLLLPSL